MMVILILNKDKTYPGTLDDLSLINHVDQHVVGIAIFLCFMKIFKFFEIFPRFNVLVLTFEFVNHINN
jgi:hypothetical protein